MNIDLGGSAKNFNFDMFIEQKIQQKVNGMDMSPVKHYKTENGIDSPSMN
jgi:hypothetical protein